MNVLIYLLPIALSLGLMGLIAFLWSLRSGQYEDLEGAALRILDDDDLRDEDTQVQRKTAPRDDKPPHRDDKPPHRDET